MKKLSLCFALFLLITGEIIAQELVYAKNLETTFFSEARFENIEAASVKGVSVLNIKNGEIAFKVFKV